MRNCRSSLRTTSRRQDPGATSKGFTTMTKSAKVLCFNVVLIFLLTLTHISFAETEQIVITDEQSVVPTPEKGSPLKLFGRELSQNFTSLFSSHNLKPLLFLSAITASSLTLDQETRDVFEETSHSDAFSNIGYQVGRPYLVAGSLGVLYLTGLSTKNAKLKAVTYDLANGYLVETGIVMALKYAVGRQRPDNKDRLSFPSGHAGSAVLGATILNHHYGPKIGIPAYLAAAYIGASRLKKDSHYLSDVIAGASIGYLVGKTITRRREVREQKLLWMPTVLTLPGKGLNLQVALIF